MIFLFNIIILLSYNYLTMGNTFEKGYILNTKDIKNDLKFKNWLMELNVVSHFDFFCEELTKLDGEYINYPMDIVINKIIGKLLYGEFTPHRNYYNSTAYINWKTFCESMSVFLMKNGYVIEHFLVKKAMENCVISLESNHDTQITIKDAVEFINYNKEMEIAKAAFEEHKKEMESGKS